MNTRTSEQPASRAFRCGMVAIFLVGLSACTVDPSALSGMRAELNPGGGVYPYSTEAQSDLALASAGTAPEQYPPPPTASYGGTPQQTVGQVVAVELIKTIGAVVRGAVSIEVAKKSGLQDSEPYYGSTYDPALE